MSQYLGGSAAKVVVMVFFLASCNDTAMNGGSAGVNPKSEAVLPQQAESPIPVYSPVAASSAIPTPTPIQSYAQSPAIDPVIQPSASAMPDGIVDGMEVINDCGRCLSRAQDLAKRINFTASMMNTINMGFYKIDPSKNLCDIHFLRDMSVEVDNHEGQDSVLNNQIAVYCPCNCGWARNPNDGSAFDSSTFDDRYSY